MSADPYALTTHDGRRVDVITHQALLAVEKRLGYELTITQGSYNAGGVSASAGTHDGGGVVDLAAYDWQDKIRALRAVGFAAWYRRADEGPWPAHIHAVLIGNKRLAPSAQRQVEAYYRGRNGLANDGRDPHARPNPVPVFQWPPKRTRVQRARDLLRAAFGDAKGGRRAAIREALRKLPPR